MHHLIRHPGIIYLTAGCFSLLLSLWISGTSFVMNTDAICYLQSAETLAQQGLHAAMNLCDQSKWPFYSFLIAGLVAIADFSYVDAAYILNGIFSLLTVLTFIGIVHHLSLQNDSYNKRSLLWLAAVVILLVNEFNSIKHYIIRDHGFWAFYLLSMLLLMYYFQTMRFKYALGWSISIIIATLFRVEGAIFLIAMPFLAWVAIKKPTGSRVTAFINLNLVTILLVICFSIWVFFYPQQSFGRLEELQFQLWYGFETLTSRFDSQAYHLGQAILNVYSVREARLVLSLTLFAWYVVSVMTNLSVIYSVLVIYAWLKHCLQATWSAKTVLWGYVLINVAITAVFLTQNMFLSKRYLVALSLVLMPWVPFALAHLMRQWPVRKWPLFVALLLIVSSSLGGIFEFGHSKKYLYDAGQRLAQHAESNSKIYSNDMLVMYYSTHFGNTVFKKTKEFKQVKVIQDGKWREHDYLALRMDKKDPKNVSSVLKEIDFPPERIFKNKRGDQVRIYKVT